MSSSLKGVLMMVASSAGFAFLPTITRHIYSVSPHFQPTDIAFWRFTFASGLMWLIFLLSQPKTPKSPPIPFWQTVVLGFLYAISAMAAFLGLQYLNASLFVVLFYTYPAMVAVISLLMGVRLSLWAWLALGLTLVGIVFTVPNLSQLTADSTFGIAVALMNALFVALYFIASSRYLKASSNMMRNTAWTMGMTWAVIALFVPFFGLHIPNLPTLLSLIVLALVSTIMPIFFINVAIQLIGAPRASIIGSLEPAIAMPIAILVLGEVVLPLQWVGALLIVLAVILLEGTPKAKNKPTT
jgi:drug/metabolite transporter (DMT)-like permease